MIAAEVSISRRMNETWEIMRWCRDNFGQAADSLDNIDEERFLWGWRSGILKTSYHFAREQDYVMFLLRWL